MWGVRTGSYTRYARECLGQAPTPASRADRLADPDVGPRRQPRGRDARDRGRTPARRHPLARHRRVARCGPHRARDGRPTPVLPPLRCLPRLAGLRRPLLGLARGIAESRQSASHPTRISSIARCSSARNTGGWPTGRFGNASRWPCSETSRYPWRVPSSDAFPRPSSGWERTSREALRASLPRSGLWSPRTSAPRSDRRIFAHPYRRTPGR